MSSKINVLFLVSLFMVHGAVRANEDDTLLSRIANNVFVANNVVMLVEAIRNEDYSYIRNSVFTLVAINIGLRAKPFINRIAPQLTERAMLAGSACWAGYTLNRILKRQNNREATQAVPGYPAGHNYQR